MLNRAERENIQLLCEVAENLRREMEVIVNRSTVAFDAFQIQIYRELLTDLRFRIGICQSYCVR